MDKAMKISINCTRLHEMLYIKYLTLRVLDPGMFSRIEHDAVAGMVGRSSILGRGRGESEMSRIIASANCCQTVMFFASRSILEG